MSSQEKKKAYTVEDYLEFIEGLIQEGFEFTFIGGCAVGAYGRLRGESVLSGDLDLYTSTPILDQALEWAERRGLPITKRPRERAIPVAVLHWDGKEVNILTSSNGLPDPPEALRLSREFEFRKRPGLKVLIADPFDLLQNKLRINRPKDQPHIEILRRFVEEEIVAAFTDETVPRERLAPARRLLEVTRSRTLPAQLAARLIPLARTPPDFRFLANNVPEREQAEAVIARARKHGDLAAELEALAGRRRFPAQKK